MKRTFSATSTSPTPDVGTAAEGVRLCKEHLVLPGLLRLLMDGLLLKVRGLIQPRGGLEAGQLPPPCRCHKDGVLTDVVVQHPAYNNRAGTSKRVYAPLNSTATVLYSKGGLSTGTSKRNLSEIK
jgi:hypothetical protein